MQAAMDQAYRFLAQRFLSSYELTQKMRRKQFEDPLNDGVLDLFTSHFLCQFIGT